MNFVQIVNQSKARGSCVTHDSDSEDTDVDIPSILNDQRLYRTLNILSLSWLKLVKHKRKPEHDFVIDIIFRDMNTASQDNFILENEKDKNYLDIGDLYLTDSFCVNRNSQDEKDKHIWNFLVRTM